MTYWSRQLLKVRMMMSVAQLSQLSVTHHNPQSVAAEAVEGMYVTGQARLMSVAQLS